MIRKSTGRSPIPFFGAILLAAVVALLAAPMGSASALRTRPAGWTKLGSISGPPEVALAPTVALNNAGRAVAVWYRISGGDIYTLRSATRQPGKNFSPAVTVGRADQTSGNNPPSVPEVALDSRGNALAVWLRKDDAPVLRPHELMVVYAEEPSNATKFGPVRALSAPGKPAFNPQVAVAANGATVVVWARLVSPGRNEIQAAIKPAGASSFRAPVTISADGANSNFPQVGIGDNGRIVVVWRSAPPAGKGGGIPSPRRSAP
jgi:hypothetical protein